MAFTDPPNDVLTHIVIVGQALTLSGAATTQDDPAWPGPLVTSLLTHLGMTMDTNVEACGANSCQDVIDEINGCYLLQLDGQMRAFELGRERVV